MTPRGTYRVAPSAARLTGSLRDIGYDASSAVADLIDNSIVAGASRVEIMIEPAETEPRILIADDGTGMSAHRLNEALRFGSRRTYGKGDLGRYGLGLKTATLSQARRLTVVSRRTTAPAVAVRQLDLDTITKFDEWLIVHPGDTEPVRRARRLLDEGLNTVVIWEHLDRLLPGRRDTGHARRRLDTWTARLKQHLSLVFHRFLERDHGHQLVISVNGEKLRPWDPYCTAEPATRELPPQTFEIGTGTLRGKIGLRRWILPARNQFTRPAAFENAGGPLKWNRQQGLYIYRADRLVQWGGWAGLRAIDEHTKLARCAIDFDTDLDELFQINVAKMRVSLPTSLRPMLERPVQEACQEAGAAYRGAAEAPPGSSDTSPARGEAKSATRPATGNLGLALLSAAARSGQLDAFRAITATLRSDDPAAAEELGLTW